MLRLPAATGLLAITALVACSTASKSGAGQAGNVNPGHFAINAGSAGNFNCPSSTDALVLQGTLMVTCAGTIKAGVMTLATLNVTGYHGTGTYNFQGSTNGTQGTLQATLTNARVDSVPASGSNQATSCTVTLSGPATLARDAEVQGHVHCDGMLADPLSGGGSSSDPTTVSADGDFAAYAAY